MGNRRPTRRVRFRRGDEPLGPGKRASVVVLAAWAVSLLAGSMAAAQVIGDPDGNVAVGTEGENVSARYAAVSNGGDAFAPNVAVSNGGNASTWPVDSVALSTGGSANGYLATSATGCSDSDVGVALSVTGCAEGWLTALSGTGNADGSSLGVGAGNGKVTNGGVTVIDLTGTGDSQVAEALELTTVVPVPDGTSEIVAGGMEILTTGLDSLPPTPSIDPTGVVSMSNNNVPSCRNITYRGNAGAIYVQVGDNGVPAMGYLHV